MFSWPTRPLVAQKSITEPESCKTVKMFFSFFLSSFFFLLSSSDGLAQYCVNFSWWFTHKTAVVWWEWRSGEGWVCEWWTSSGNAKAIVTNSGSISKLTVWCVVVIATESYSWKGWVEGVTTVCQVAPWNVIHQACTGNRELCSQVLCGYTDAHHVAVMLLNTWDR